MRALIVFTRAPLPGRTKTRMMPYLDAEECALLHEAMLRDISRECAGCRADLFISYTPLEGLQSLRSIFGRSCEYLLQEGEGLGERMYHAIENVLSRGYSSCILTGSDIAELRSADLERAFGLLERADLVFGRSRDGGYYLIGMKKAWREAFDLGSYGHRSVFEDTLSRLAKKRLKIAYVRTLYDLDTKEDLRFYRERMRRYGIFARKDQRRQKLRAGKLQRGCLGRFLKERIRISIIIPVYNEEKTILALQEQLLPHLNEAEIIFADGGSSDRSTELIDERFRLIRTPKGRALQMNEAARQSSGDVLFFLHCDSELPQNFLEEIREVIADYRAGCFGIAFHSRNFFMFTCRVISNHRIKDRKVMFGDQGIFIERKLFFEAGMFPLLPIMEDYQFSLTLKQMGVRLGIAKHRIYTSDRRFRGSTMDKLRLMWKMNRLRKMYRDGIDIERIARLYRDLR